MEVKELNSESYMDLFGQAAQPGATSGPRFGSIEDANNADLFSTVETTTVPSTVETTTVASTVETTTVASATGETTHTGDILTNDTDPNKSTGGRRPKYDFTDASGYFADRVKSGKFVAIEDVAEDGTKKIFVPSTPEEFDDFIDIQLNEQLKQKSSELEAKWYQGKSPAWQAVAKFSEMVDDPTEIVPFLQGVKTIDSVEGIDENDLDGAEKIVRVRLEQRGDSDDVIDEQIEALKTTSKLVSAAQKYKPLIIQQEKQRLSQMVQQKQQQEQAYIKMVEEVKGKAIQAIETPLFGKTKLKNDEKAAIYDLIAEPNPEQQGYGIYGEIDSLFEKGDFETLKLVALLLKKKDSFLGYISSNAATKTAESLQRQLRVATDTRSTGGKDLEIEEGRKVVQRNQYSTAKFGRG